MRIALHTDNAAFQENGKAVETARILRELANKIEIEGLPTEGGDYELRDVNGNACGLCWCEQGEFIMLV